MSGAITAVVVSVAAADVVAATIGAEILGSTLLADVVTGAIVGGLSGGASSIVTGGDIGDGIFSGALTGGVSGGIGNIASDIAPSINDFGKNTLGLSSEATKALTTGATKLASGTATGLVRGQDFGSALKGGAIGALGSVASNYLVGDPSSQSTADKFINQAEKGVLSAGINKLLGGNSTSQSSGKGYTPSTVSTTGQSGGSAGSQALAQALNVGDPSTSLSGETGGKYKNVWNTASLKNPNEDLGTQNG